VYKTVAFLFVLPLFISLFFVHANVSEDPKLLVKHCGCFYRACQWSWLYCSAV